MKKILLIEDEILIQKSLKKLLEARGAIVSVESSGKDAIETIFQNDFDKIICDLMLKDITGFDVIEESKKRYTIDEIGHLFVIITAYSSQQVLDKANGYGCNVISKPFDDMDQALKTFLE